jgi:hypothetical protein
MRNAENEKPALNTAVLLNDRIRSAKNIKSPVVETSVDELLANLSVQPVSEHGTAEEILCEENRENEPGFQFRQISSKEDVAYLIELFEKQAGPKERWPFDIWLERAVDYQSMIIEVKRDDEDAPSGFAVINAKLELGCKADGAAESIIVLHVNLNSVYVAPGKRGKGHSQALSWAIGKQVNQVLHALAEVPSSSQELLQAGKVEIFIEGEAHSEGGANFLAGTVEHIKSNMDFINLEKAWFNVPQVIDDVDLDKFSRLAALR